MPSNAPTEKPLAAAAPVVTPCATCGSEALNPECGVCRSVLAAGPCDYGTHASLTASFNCDRCRRFLSGALPAHPVPHGVMEAELKRLY